MYFAQRHCNPSLRAMFSLQPVYKSEFYGGVHLHPCTNQRIQELDGADFRSLPSIFAFHVSGVHLVSQQTMHYVCDVCYARERSHCNYSTDVFTWILCSCQFHANFWNVSELSWLAPSTKIERRTNLIENSNASKPQDVRKGINGGQSTLRIRKQAMLDTRLDPWLFG